MLVEGTKIVKFSIRRIPQSKYIVCNANKQRHDLFSKFFVGLQREAVSLHLFDLQHNFNCVSNVLNIKLFLLISSLLKIACVEAIR